MKKYRQKYRQNTVSLYMFDDVFDAIHIITIKYIFNNIPTPLEAWNIDYNFDDNNKVKL